MKVFADPIKPAYTETRRVYVSPQEEERNRIAKLRGKYYASRPPKFGRMPDYAFRELQMGIARQQQTVLGLSLFAQILRPKR